jgi:hypothetical protein
MFTNLVSEKQSHYCFILLFFNYLWIWNALIHVFFFLLCYFYSLVNCLLVSLSGFVLCLWLLLLFYVLFIFCFLQGLSLYIRQLIFDTTCKYLPGTALEPPFSWSLPPE